MPFVGYEVWEAPIFEKYKDADVVIPTSDDEAYMLYPELRKFYYKPLLCDMQGLHNIPLADITPIYKKMIVKPVSNMYGMGIGCQIIDNIDDVEYQPGYFLMELLYGDHISTDLIVENGVVKWFQSALGYPGTEFTFDYWELVFDNNINHIEKFISEHLSDYSGVMNVECIGDGIIELTFRLSTQFIDLYDPYFLDRVVNFYETGKFNGRGLNKTKGYSVPIFADEYHEFPQAYKYKFTNTMVDGDFNPSGGKRVGYINGEYIEGLLKTREELLKDYNNADYIIRNAWRVISKCCTDIDWFGKKSSG